MGPARLRGGRRPGGEIEEGPPYLGEKKPGYTWWEQALCEMAGPELLLDSNIRLWVVLPIVIITFFVGMIRHYVSILLQSDKKLTQEQVSDRSAPSLSGGLTPP